MTDLHSAAVTDKSPIIRLDDVWVRYRIPHERIPSFKEFAIKFIKGQIRYVDFWALKDVSLSILPGEVFGIIGPNGAGKSTLLKVVARVLWPKRGRVRVSGRLAPLLELGAGFDSELTGRENIYLNAAILGFSRRSIDERFDRIVEFSGLRDFIDAPLRTYSTGMEARLGFAVATDERPDILIVDEILGVGDAEFQVKSTERIRSFQQAGTTILFVSHRLFQIQEMCTRVLWLDHGQPMAVGDTNAVVNQYREFNMDRQIGRVSDQRTSHIGAVLDIPDLQIFDVRLTDENGMEQEAFRTGQTMKIHLDYQTKIPIGSPIFSITIHRHDGVFIGGPTTEAEALLLPRLDGRGTVTYTIPSLPLLEGYYVLSVLSTNRDHTIVYHRQDRGYPIQVLGRADTVADRNGLIAFAGVWEHLLTENSTLSGERTGRG